ncbi:hypothetical protein [Planococcus faecalis]
MEKQQSPNSHQNHSHSTEQNHSHDQSEKMHEEHGSNHHGHQEHGNMVEDFKKRFFISLILTLPILALSPMIQDF